MPGVVENLEREFAAGLGVAGAVATGFGRSALALALEAALPEGGDVLVPDFICAQVPEAVRRAGGRPVFYRVHRDLSVSPAEFRGEITRGTRAAVVAHYYGRSLANIGELAAACRDRGVFLVEDCALALGARVADRAVGTFGDAAVFSFTKSDWCYGGGIVASNSADLLGRFRTLRKGKFRTAPGLAWRYGFLRRADFAANRPSLCRTATSAGRLLERILLPATRNAPGRNFFDAGRFDAAMRAFAARRARRVLANLQASARRRRELLEQLRVALRGCEHVLARPGADEGEADTFLLLHSPAGLAPQWVERADRARVTLRFCWPAYQSPEPEQASPDLDWLAERLLVLEMHPGWTPAEVKRIGFALRDLSEGEGN